ncbi:unnamed protein product [Sphagnum balticum]
MLAKIDRRSGSSLNLLSLRVYFFRCAAVRYWIEAIRAQPVHAAIIAKVGLVILNFATAVLTIGSHVAPLTARNVRGRLHRMLLLVRLERYYIPAPYGRAIG